MLITQGCDPAVREMKSTASSSRTESPKLASPPVLRSARWTKMRSASGAMPTGPPAWPLPAAMSRTWVPCVPVASRVRDRRVIPQPLVRPRVVQRAVDLAPGRGRSRIRTDPGAAPPPGPAGPRTPGTGCRPAGGPVGGRRAGGPAERGRVHVHAPVDGRHHHARAVRASPGLRRTSVGRMLRDTGCLRSGAPAPAARIRG